MSLCGYVHVCADACEGQKHQIPLELQIVLRLQVLCCLEMNELRSSARAINTCTEQLSHLSSPTLLKFSLFVLL